MIKCEKCNFKVTDVMKHALKQNACPSCGKDLFTQADSNMLAMIRTSLIGHKFSKALPEDLFYDVTLFVFNEIKSGVGKKFADERIRLLNIGYDSSHIEPPDISEGIWSPPAEDGDSDDSGDSTELSEEEQLEIKRKIGKEYEAILSGLDDSDMPGLDEDGDVVNSDHMSKAERLKELHKQQQKATVKSRRTGFQVRRIES